MQKVVQINIGDCQASSHPVIFSTLLGSCVSVCLYDPITHVGGMNHILHPGLSRVANPDRASQQGPDAMARLIEIMIANGGRRERLVAKVFGGGSCVETFDDHFDIGARNQAYVFKYLADNRINVLSQDVGGEFSRRVMFDTNTGDVFVKRRKLKSDPGPADSAT